MRKKQSRPHLNPRFPLASDNKVLPDTNVFVTYIMSKSDQTLVCAVFDKVRTSDELIITNQVMSELYSLDLSRKHVTHLDITNALRKLQPRLIYVCNPSAEDLSAFSIEDEDDKIILYSARESKADIILTDDKVWFKDDVYGADVEIIDPFGYVHYDEIKSGEMEIRNPGIGRIKRIFSKRR